MSELLSPEVSAAATESSAERLWHEWLTTRPGREAIASFRVEDQQLFFPAAP